MYEIVKRMQKYGFRRIHKTSINIEKFINNGRVDRRLLLWHELILLRLSKGKPTLLLRLVQTKSTLLVISCESRFILITKSSGLSSICKSKSGIRSLWLRPKSSSCLSKSSSCLSKSSSCLSKSSSCLSKSSIVLLRSKTTSCWTLLPETEPSALLLLLLSESSCLQRLLLLSKSGISSLWLCPKSSSTLLRSKARGSGFIKETHQD
eukprot:NODE_137_length_18042_cov_0.768823.p8 type:complete len:207 gc:universal NODE_137_length_18042_cov_0.768823:863-243(-)